MREILFEYVKRYREVIIYGCGNNGLFLQWIFQRNGIKIHFMCDSNKELWGRNINGIVCLCPEELLEHKDALIIVGIYKYEEVLRSLEGYQLKKVITWKQVKFLLEDLKSHPDELFDYREIVLNKNPELKKILSYNIKFKEIHQGKRCFIIGNGPSIKKQDLSLLKNEITFTVNQIARNPQFQEIQTNYHVWADPNFFDKNLESEGDYQLLEIMKSLPKNVECFFPYEAAYEYINTFELNNYINVNYYSSDAIVNENELVDLTRYIRKGYTVVQYAIRLAIYMGFKKIYILGCECTTILNVINARLSDYSSVTHCYNINKEERERARKMYMKLSMQEYYRSEFGVLEEYRKIREYCDVRGISIYNCTPGGLLEELSRCSFDSIVKNI